MAAVDQGDGQNQNHPDRQIAHKTHARSAQPADLRHFRLSLQNGLIEGMTATQDFGTGPVSEQLAHTLHAVYNLDPIIRLQIRHFRSTAGTQTLSYKRQDQAGNSQEQKQGNRQAPGEKSKKTGHQHSSHSGYQKWRKYPQIKVVQGVYVGDQTGQDVS